MNLQEVIDAINEEWESKLRKMVIEIVSESFLKYDNKDNIDGLVVYLKDVLDIIYKYK